MSLGLASSPSFPIAGEETTLSLTGAAGAGDVSQFYLDSVPASSAITTGLLVDGAGLPVMTFTPDVEGSYTVRGIDFVSFNAPPSHGADPAGGGGRTRCAGAVSGTVYCVANADLPLITKRGDAATLRLGVANNIVRVATLVDMNTDAARVAALNATVVTKLAALVGVATSAIDDDLFTSANNFRANYERHRAETGGGVHVSSDSTDGVRLQTVNSTDAAIALYGEIYDRLIAHMDTAGAWHAEDDAKNVPLLAKSADHAACTMMACELRYRVYERHRVQTATPASHGIADNTWVLTASKPLADLVVAYLDVLATTTPTAIAGEEVGLQRLAHIFGFKPAS